MTKRKNDKTSGEMDRLNTMVALVPEDRKHIAEKLAQEIAFMEVTLDKLKVDIGERGAVELFKQGKQEFLRESPALKAYNTTIQRYSLLYKQLSDLIPKSVQAEQKNALMDFIKQG